MTRVQPSLAVIPAEQRHEHPELEPDFAVLARHVDPVFARYDRRSFRLRRLYRGLQLTIILGSVVVTGLGGLQALLPGERWPGILLAVLGVVLAACGQWVLDAGAQAGALGARVKAERLRALSFAYLSRRGHFAGDDRDRELRRAVLAIDAGREVA